VRVNDFIRIGWKFLIGHEGPRSRWVAVLVQRFSKQFGAFCWRCRFVGDFRRLAGGFQRPSSFRPSIPAILRDATQPLNDEVVNARCRGALNLNGLWKKPFTEFHPDQLFQKTSVLGSIRAGLKSPVRPPLFYQQAVSKEGETKD
jgi:hypothetical protein